MPGTNKIIFKNDIYLTKEVTASDKAGASSLENLAYCFITAWDKYPLNEDKNRRASFYMEFRDLTKGFESIKHFAGLFSKWEILNPFIESDSDEKGVIQTLKKINIYTEDGMAVYMDPSDFIKSQKTQQAQAGAGAVKGPAETKASFFAAQTGSQQTSRSPHVPSSPVHAGAAGEAATQKKQAGAGVSSTQTQAAQNQHETKVDHAAAYRA